MYNFILTLDNIEDIAEAILELYPQESVYLFMEKWAEENHTDQALCDQLTWSYVTSPLCGINEYWTQQEPIYHFDFTVLKRSEVIDLGVHDYIESGHYWFYRVVSRSLLKPHVVVKSINYPGHPGGLLLES